MKLCWGLDGGDPFKMIDGMTPLHIAVSQGHVSMVGWMLIKMVLIFLELMAEVGIYFKSRRRIRVHYATVQRWRLFLRMKNLFSADERTYHLSANEINRGFFACGG